MPIYEFECKKCDKITEKYFDIKDNFPKETKCSCGNIAEKIISNLHIRIPNPTSEARRGRGSSKS